MPTTRPDEMTVHPALVIEAADALERQQAVVEALEQLDFAGPGDVVHNLEGVLSDWDDHGFDEVDAATLRAVQNQLWAVKKALAAPAEGEKP